MELIMMWLVDRFAGVLFPLIGLGLVYLYLIEPAWDRYSRFKASRAAKRAQ